LVSRGEPAQDGQFRIRFVPLPQPVFGIEVKRIREGEPSVDLIGRRAVLRVPIVRPGRLLDVRLVELRHVQTDSRKVIKAENETGRLFDLPFIGDEAGTGASSEHWNLPMNAEDFENGLGLGRQFGRDENQSKLNRRRRDALPQVGRPFREAGFVKATGPMRRRTELARHGLTVTS